MSTFTDYVLGASKREKQLIDLEEKRQKAILAAQGEQAIKLRDSDQLSKDFNRHKYEREQQEALARMFPSTTEGLSPEQRDLEALALASQKMDEIKVAQPLADSSSAMNLYQQNQAIAPSNAEIGQSSAEAKIGANRGTASQGNLTSAINAARMLTAPGASSAQDQAVTIESVPLAEANVAEALLKKRTAPIRESMLSSAFNRQNAQDVYESGVYDQRDPRLAAVTADADLGQKLALYDHLAKNPQDSRSIYHTPLPTMQNVMGAQMMGVDPMSLYGRNTSALPNGQLNPPVGSGNTPGAFKFDRSKLGR